jgi:ribonuclease HI
MRAASIPTILVYTDGACSGNPGPAGLGVVVRYDGDQRELSGIPGPWNQQHR